MYNSNNIMKKLHKIALEIKSAKYTCLSSLSGLINRLVEE